MDRVRFAPSPTGSLHVGGVRTALYNWLWAKKVGGKFILRIEDTDLDRNTPDSYSNILRSMEWLGLNWDEGPDCGGNYGPYTQSERKELYINTAETLIKSNFAYRCSCSKDDLSDMRKDFESKFPKGIWKYPGLCRDKAVSADTKHVVRLKVPDTIITYDDLVFGKITTPASSMYDFVLLREDKVPLYNFAAVVDDHYMKISLVGRGKDHMINTPPQILIYEALGWELPKFAHLPMMLNKEGHKLSKRDGAVSVDVFKSLGYSANGLLNYLVRFGWAHKDLEIFSMDELISLFDWKDCKRSDGRFDLDKALAINAKNFSRKDLVSDEVYLSDLKEFCLSADIRSIDLVRAKSKSYLNAAEMLKFLDCDFLKQVSSSDFTLINALVNNYSKLDLFNKQSLLDNTKEYCQANNCKLQDVAKVLRNWITQQSFGADIFEIIVYLGKDKVHNAMLDLTISD